MTTSDVTRTTVRSREHTAVIDLAGDINGAAEGALESAWQEAMVSAPEAVVLNFQGAGYINSTGIALIVGMLAKARARGIPLSAYGLTPHYREIFEITRLADFMAISTDEDSAVQGGANDEAAATTGGAEGSTT